jgi:hypothetical protein
MGTIGGAVAIVVDGDRVWGGSWDVDGGGGEPTTTAGGGAVFTGACSLFMNNKKMSLKQLKSETWKRRINCKNQQKGGAIPKIVFNVRGPNVKWCELCFKR